MVSVDDGMGSPVMVEGSIGFGDRPSSPEGRRHPDTSAFVQTHERFSSCGGAAVSQMRVALAESHAPEVLDRWTIANHDRRSVALTNLTPGRRRQVNAFVALLLDGSVEQCERATRRALDIHGDPQTVADMLFAPAARMIGESWRADECSFVAVTMVVSRLQRMFRLIISERPPESGQDPVRSVLLAPAPGEQHAFGLSIVEDAFQRAGWEVDCCGCGDEAKMFSLARTKRYSVIGISIAAQRLLPALSSTIAKLRTKSLDPSVIMIAGGSLAIEKPQAAIDAGFDFVAITARSAVKLSESVLSSRSHPSHASIAAE